MKRPPAELEYVFHVTPRVQITLHPFWWATIARWDFGTEQRLTVLCLTFARWRGLPKFFT